MRLITPFNVEPSRFSSNYARTNVGTASPPSQATRPKPRAIAQSMPPATSRLSQKEREDNILVNAIAKGVAKAVTDFAQDPALTVAKAVMSTRHRDDLVKLSANAVCDEQSGAITTTDHRGKFVAHMIRNGAGEWQMRARQ